MRIRTITVLLIALVAAACSQDVGEDRSTTTTTADPGTTTSVVVTGDETTTTVEATTTTVVEAAGITVELTSCAESGDFDILCEAYNVITREFVDPLDDAVLAAGASQGIAEFLEAGGGDSGLQTITCPLPADAFAEMCEAAATALASLDTDISSVAEAAVAGLLEFGLNDPNSRYLPPDVLERVAEEQTGTISGIGSLVVTEEEIDGETVRCNVITDTCKMNIVSVIEGGPAEAAGLQSGDVMVTVDGESIEGWTSEEIVAAVRGPEGEPVTLEIDRSGEIIEFTIVRAPIVVPVTSTQYYGDGVGYVKLSQFTNNSGTLFREALQEMIDAGATTLIIDFQNNPGGALNAAIAVASEFLDEGTVLITQSPGDENVYNVNSGGVAVSNDLEIIVLVNRGSASASEVVAGVLQETGRATILGESTFGKNTVQQQYALSNGGAVKVTIARWVTPSGADFGGLGVMPDLLIEIPVDETTQFLIDRALEYVGIEP